MHARPEATRVVERKRARGVGKDPNLSGTLFRRLRVLVPQWAAPGMRTTGTTDPDEHMTDAATILDPVNLFQETDRNWLAHRGHPRTSQKTAMTRHQTLRLIMANIECTMYGLPTTMRQAGPAQLELLHIEPLTTPDRTRLWE